MGAPFGSAICAKRKRSFPARDCFENPGASLMSESSSLGSCRSSTRVPFWQQIDGFVTVKRSAPQFMHTSRCSKKLIGCAASRLLKHVAFCRHSRRYCTPSASDGHRGTRAAPTVVGAAAHERTLYSRVLIWPEEESRYWRGSFSIVNVSKTASVGVSGVRRARAGSHPIQQWQAVAPGGLHARRIQRRRLARQQPACALDVVVALSSVQCTVAGIPSCLPHPLKGLPCGIRLGQLTSPFTVRPRGPEEIPSRPSQPGEVSSLI
jgi:hypothetical protein